MEIFGKVESKSPVTQKDSFEIDMFVGLMKFKDSRKFSFEKLEDVRKKNTSKHHHEVRKTRYFGYFG